MVAWRSSRARYSDRGCEIRFESRVLKEQLLDEIEQHYPAHHYVMVDDKLRILAAMKKIRESSDYRIPSLRQLGQRSVTAHAPTWLARRLRPRTTLAMLIC